MNRIEQIWFDYIQTEEYQTNEEYNYSISKDSQDELESLLGKEHYLKAENMAYELAADAERFGFVQGFKMAMQIREECLRKIA